MELLATLSKNTNWADFFSQKHFWLEYFAGGGLTDFLFEYYSIEEGDEYWLAVDKEEVPTLTFELPFPGGYKLVFSFLFYGGLDEIWLVYPTDSSLSAFATTVLGWDNAHFMGDIFRWEEMHSLVECLEKTGKLPFNRLVLLLLLRKFTPATLENYELAFSQTEKYLEELGLVDQEEASELLDNLNFIREDLEWVYQPEQGWVACGDEHYSFREFPAPTVPVPPFFNREVFNPQAFRNFMGRVYSELGSSNLY